MQSVILTLCSAPTTVLSFFFHYQVEPPPQPRHCQGSRTEVLVRGGSTGGSSWWGLYAASLLPCRIKSSTAAIILHGRSSLYWFVGNSTTVQQGVCCLDLSMVFDSEIKEMGKNLIRTWMLVLGYFRMQIFKAALSRVTAECCCCRASGVWLLPSLVGFPKFFPSKFPPWNGRNITENTQWVTAPFYFENNFKCFSECPCVLFVILKTTLLFAFPKTLNSSC